MPSRILLDVDKIMENMRQIAIDYPDHFTSFWPTDLIYIVDTLVQRERALHDWQPIAAAQKNTPYLIAYRNAYGKDRVIKAVYIERYTVESNLDAECDDEYDEGTDTYYWCEGWYELVDNFGDYTHLRLDTTNVPTHFMPLPTPPAEFAP